MSMGKARPALHLQYGHVRRVAYIFHAMSLTSDMAHMSWACTQPQHAAPRLNDTVNQLSEGNLHAIDHQIVLGLGPIQVPL